MIKAGKRSSAKYWGAFEVQDLVTLDSPVKCFSTEKGEVDFNPTIVKVAWEREPSGDKHDLWFPYWITINAKEKYGQFAPMIGQRALLELLSKAVDRGFFEKAFLEGLREKIVTYLEGQEAVRANTQSPLDSHMHRKENHTVSLGILLDRTTPQIRSFILELRKFILQLSRRIEEKCTKRMITYHTIMISKGGRGTKGLFWFNLANPFILRVHLRKGGDYHDMYNRLVREGWGGYPEIIFEQNELDDRCLEYLKSLITEAHKVL